MLPIMTERDTQRALRLAADALERKAEKEQDEEAAGRLYDRMMDLREMANRIPDQC